MNKELLLEDLRGDIETLDYMIQNATNTGRGSDEVVRQWVGELSAIKGYLGNVKSGRYDVKP